MTPFDTTKTVPAGWSRHHASAATGGMNATVTVRRPDGAPAYNPATDDTEQPYVVLYDRGPARIQELLSSRAADSAGQEVTGRSYLVALDALHPGADLLRLADGPLEVRVDVAPNDALLGEEVLYVLDVMLGSERFERDLICSDNQTDAIRTV